MSSPNRYLRRAVAAAISVVFLLMSGACGSPTEKNATPEPGAPTESNVEPGAGPSPQASGADPSSPRITLGHADRPGFWRVTYELDSETGFLRFQRPAAFYREDVWEILTPGWSLARDEDHQILVANDGATTDHLVIEFPVYSEHIPKEYEFFLSFTDGSVAIYTGHFYVTTSGIQVPDEESDFLRRVELLPGPDEQLIVQGEVFKGPTLWTDPNGDGTYIYYGRIEPLETADMIGIIDPGAPPWLVQQMNEMLPEMFAMYVGGLHEPLPWKPVVLFSFEDRKHSGLSSGGGTLHGLVQMSALGDGWHDATPDSSEQLLYLVAHEAAHFWNGQLHTYEEMADSWMHEGGADAMASLALRQHGYIDDARLTERWTGALNICARGLQDGSLSSSGSRQQFGNYYSCGELIAIWSTAALPQDPSSTDLDRLFRIWRTIFEHSDPDDGSYNRDTYFQALDSLGVDAATLDALRDLLDAEVDDPSAALVTFMAHAGIQIDRPDRPPSGQRLEWAVATLQHLMADTCNGRYGFKREKSRLRAVAIDSCKPFDRELLVVSIQGHGLDDGDLAFKAAFNQCELNQPVTLRLEDGTDVPAPCTSPLPPQPAPLAFPGYRP